MEPLRGTSGKHRYFAAVLDGCLAPVAALIVAKTMPASPPWLAGLVFVLAWFGYYGLFEGAFGATFGKWYFGILVCDSEGRPCGWVRSLVRTVLRAVEVNPILAGALPAIGCIYLTRRRQRIGDLLSGSCVVKRKDLSVWRAQRDAAQIEEAAIVSIAGTGA